MYKISKLARIFSNDKVNIISAGTQQFLADDNEFKEILEILEFVKEAKSENEINIFLNQNNFSVGTFNKLVDSKMITNNKSLFNVQDTPIFKNQLYIESIYPNTPEILNNFSQYIFIIVGAGGIGNYMSYALNSLNPKEIIIIDGDTIESSNLNRQFLFSEDDIGKYKSDILKRKLKDRNPSTSIQTITEFGTYEILDNLLFKYKDDKTFIVLSGDSSNILKDVTTISAKHKTPFLNIGYLNDISIIGPFFIPGVSSCPFCNDTFSVSAPSKSADIIEYVNKQNSGPSSFINNAISSSMGMIDIIAYMSGDYSNINSLNRRLGVSNRDFKKIVIENKLDPMCLYCKGL